MPPLPSVNQVNIIEILNVYAELHQLPLGVDKSGICKGLSLLYASYVLDDSEHEFFRLLHLIGRAEILEESHGLNDEINHFVAQVVLTQTPGRFDSELSQRQSHTTLGNVSSPMQNTFSFGLVTSKENWARIIDELNLQEDEVVNVSSSNHAIAIRKQGDNFIVYNPNYHIGKKLFRSAESLINELHSNNVFNYADQNMGLSLNLFSKKRDRACEDLPDINGLYDKYLVGNDVNQKCYLEHYGKLIGDTSMIFAIKSGQKDGLSKLLELQEKNAGREVLNVREVQTKYIYQAVFWRNVEALDLFLPRFDDKGVASALEAALLCGDGNAFNLLLNKKSSLVNRIISMSENRSCLINAAISGQDIRVLRYVFDNLPQIHTDWNGVLYVNKHTQRIDALRSYNSPSTLKIVLDKINEPGANLDEKAKVALLRTIIGTNNIDVLRCLLEHPVLEKIKPKEISFDFNEIRVLNADILELLNEKKICISSLQDDFIKMKKEHQSPSFAVKLGVITFQLMNFSLFRQLFDEIKSVFNSIFGREEVYPDAPSLGLPDQNNVVKEDVNVSPAKNPQQFFKDECQDARTQSKFENDDNSPSTRLGH